VSPDEATLTRICEAAAAAAAKALAEELVRLGAVTARPGKHPENAEPVPEKAGIADRHLADARAVMRGSK